MTDIHVDEDRIRKGMDEVAKLRSLAEEAVAQAKKARDEANYFKGQKEMLERQKGFDDDRHQKDLRRIAELEATLTSLLETFALAEAKVRQRKPEDQFDEDIRKLATARISTNASTRPVPEQGRG